MPKGCVQHSRFLMIDWEINGEGMHRLCHHLDTHSAGRCVIGLKQPRPASCPPEAAPKPPGTSAGDAQGLRWPPPAPRRQAEAPFQSWRGGSRLERRFYRSSFQHCTRSLPNESNTPEPQGARGAESLGARGPAGAPARCSWLFLSSPFLFLLSRLFPGAPCSSFATQPLATGSG